MTQRILTASELAAMTGKSARYYQKLAKAGKIPASQPAGPGTALYFNAEEYEAWMARGRNRKKQWPTSTGEKAGRGQGRRSKEWKDENPLELVLKQKLKNISSSSSRR